MLLLGLQADSFNILIFLAVARYAVVANPNLVRSSPRGEAMLVQRHAGGAG